MCNHMCDWKELCEDERQAATELGWTPEIWDMLELGDIHSYVRDFCGNGYQNRTLGSPLIPVEILSRFRITYYAA